MSVFAFFILALSFFIGGCLGSFVSVLIHRIPKKEDWIVKPSYCPDCGTPIPLWLNLPFIGALILIFAYHKRTACCQKPIRLKYLYLETIGGCIGAVIALVCLWFFGP
jgi:leader peptidase (prepilin peptidase)/N-methyltransferase